MSQPGIVKQRPVWETHISQASKMDAHNTPGPIATDKSCRGTQLTVAQQQALNSLRVSELLKAAREGK